MQKPELVAEPVNQSPDSEVITCSSGFFKAYVSPLGQSHSSKVYKMTRRTQVYARLSPLPPPTPSQYQHKHRLKGKLYVVTPSAFQMSQFTQSAVLTATGVERANMYFFLAAAILSTTNIHILTPDHSSLPEWHQPGDWCSP